LFCGIGLAMWRVKKWRFEPVQNGGIREHRYVWGRAELRTIKTHARKEQHDPESSQQ
jgi:hypothetical protein